MLKINNLVVEVEGKLILGGVDLEVNPGEVVVVMGPNGSGKSTLANTLAGHPKYIITNNQITSIPNNKQLPNSKKQTKNETGGIIVLDRKDISGMSADQRANQGLFLASQYPVAIPGLTVNSFLWQIYKKRHTDNNKISNVVAFRKWLGEQAVQLGLKSELLTRGLNDGFSGGEKKKLEILQMLVFNPKYVILDEIDSGLDIDALKLIALTVANIVKEKEVGVIVITHYNRILKFLTPDRVVVMEKGKVVRTGKGILADEIESKGYKND